MNGFVRLVLILVGSAGVLPASSEVGTGGPETTDKKFTFTASGFTKTGTKKGQGGSLLTSYVRKANGKVAAILKVNEIPSQVKDLEQFSANLEAIYTKPTDEEGMGYTKVSKKPFKVAEKIKAYAYQWKVPITGEDGESLELDMEELLFLYEAEKNKWRAYVFEVYGTPGTPIFKSIKPAAKASEDDPPTEDDPSGENGGSGAATTVSNIQFKLAPGWKKDTKEKKIAAVYHYYVEGQLYGILRVYIMAGGTSSMEGFSKSQEADGWTKGEVDDPELTNAAKKLGGKLLVFIKDDEKTHDLTLWIRRHEGHDYVIQCIHAGNEKVIAGWKQAVTTLKKVKKKTEETTEEGE